MLLSVRRRTVLLGVGVVFFALFALRQQALAERLEALHDEARQVVAYLERQRAETGAYPGDLSGYRFSQPALAEYVGYWPDDQPRATTYALDYHPLNGIGVQHRYSPGSGWRYNDD